MTIETTVLVPESRQVKLTLPPETPTEPVRENPDTPEFRGMYQRTHDLMLELQEWFRERRHAAIQNGVDPDSVIGNFKSQEERHQAFEAWKAERAMKKAAA